MPAPFTPRADRMLRIVPLFAAITLVAAVWALVAWQRSAPATGVGSPRAQPVSFSHALHAGRLDIDCRFCHTGVDRGAVAGLPTTQTCMTCHSQIWLGATPLAPLRESFASGEPLSWARLHRLPDHVRFHHAIHLDKGVACATCHGAVEEMVETVRVRQMTMAWCLDCHRAPERHLVAPASLSASADPRAILAHLGIDPAGLTDCSVCHY
jgi:hypothetical protein